MKSLFAVVVGLVMMLPPLVGAEEETPTSPRFTKATLEQTEKSLAAALESNILQMQATAALTVKDLKKLYPDYSFSRLIIPLMRVVKDDDISCKARVPAAIALHELHSARGDFAIERTAFFTSCKHTAHVCNWLTYYQYLEDHPEPVRLSANVADFTFDPLPEEFVE